MWIAALALGMAIAPYGIVQWVERRRWIGLRGASGQHPEAITGLHARLKGKGIRYRLKVLGLGGEAGGSFNQSYILLVHKDDL